MLGSKELKRKRNREGVSVTQKTYKCPKNVIALDDFQKYV
jgi:hypothetical protein